MSDRIFGQVERQLNRKANFASFVAYLIVYGLAFSIIAIPVGVVEYVKQGHRSEYTITVDSKDPCMRAKCHYRVYSTDGQVFQNSDELVWGWRWKMDSANMQAKLRVGHTYRIKTVGFRVPFLSWFENIIYADEVTSGHS